MPVVQLETDSIELNVEEISSMNGINMYKVQFIRIDHRFAERKTRVAFEMFLAESELQALFSSWGEMNSNWTSV